MFFFFYSVLDASSNTADSEANTVAIEQGSHGFMHGSINEAVGMRGEPVTCQGQRLKNKKDCVFYL